MIFYNLNEQSMMQVKGKINRGAIIHTLTSGIDFALSVPNAASGSHGQDRYRHTENCTGPSKVAYKSHSVNEIM